MSDDNQEIQNVDYSYRFLLNFKLIALIILVSFGIIFSFLDITGKIDAQIHSLLKINKTCNIKFKDYRVEFFSPKIIIDNIEVPRFCFGGKVKSDFKLKQATVFFRGISFSPFGLSTKIATNIMGQKLEAYIIPGFTSLSVILENDSNNKQLSDINKISLDQLTESFDKIKLSGDIFLSKLYLKLGYSGKLEDMAVNIASKNLLLPSQGFLFGLPLSIKDPIYINKFLLQAMSSKGTKLAISEFVLGDNESAIIADFNGIMKLNLSNLLNSSIDIKGQTKFSKKFLNDYAIVGMGLSKFDKKDDFYQIQLKGKLGKPNVDSPRK